MNCSPKKIAHSSNKEITMANGSTADKAAKARSKAYDAKYYGGDSMDIASKVAKTATGKRLTFDEEVRAGKIIQARRTNDTARTATRASFMERRTAKKAAEKRMNAAVSGGAAPKKQAPKATTKKVAPAKPKAGLPKTGRQNVKKTGKK
jgi:hypothetical protein